MKYEIMVILNPKQTDKEIEKQLGEVKDSIAENGFTVVDEDVWGPRNLAYKIKNLTEGYYVVMVFEGDPEGAQQLNKDLRLQTSIVRYMIVKVADDYVMIRYDNTPKVGGKQKLSKHAEELNKKMSEKKAAPKEEAATEEKEEKAEETAEEPKELDEKLQAIIDDTDIDL